MKMFKHLQDINEPYFTHMKHAFHISYQMLFGSISAFIHAIYPDICQNTASNISKNIIKLIENRKN